jgi:hypothetical protein
VKQEIGELWRKNLENLVWFLRVALVARLKATKTGKLEGIAGFRAERYPLGHYSCKKPVFSS